MLLRFEMICASGHVKSLKQCINNVTQFCETLHEPCSFNQVKKKLLSQSLILFILNNLIACPL